MKKFLLAGAAWLALAVPCAAQVASSLTDSQIVIGAAGSTSTVSGINAGPAFAGRVICDLYNNTNQLATATATIDGIAAWFEDTADGYGFACVEDNTANTTVSVTLTFAGGAGSTTVSNGMFALTGASSATPAFVAANPSGASVSVNVPAKGSMLAVAVAQAAGSWTGPTQQLAWQANGVSAASLDNSGGAITGQTASYSGALFMIAASFSPAAAPSGGVTRRSLTGVGN